MRFLSAKVSNKFLTSKFLARYFENVMCLDAEKQNRRIPEESGYAAVVLMSCLAHQGQDGVQR